MLLHQRTSRSLAVFALFTFAGAWDALSDSPAAPSFFRSDRGITRGKSRFPDRLDQRDALRWRVPLDPGHSSPVICGRKLFLTTYQASNQELATVAFDAESGKLSWRQVAPADRVEPFHRMTGSPAAATPACDGNRVYVFFGSYGLICYTSTGEMVWDKRLGPFQDEFGASSSPLLVDDKLILCQDHDLDSFLMALDPPTGRTLWKAGRPDAVRSYSTPALWTRNGHKELLVAGALELAAYHPASGEKLWWLNGLARIVIPVPVPSGDLIYMASWTPGGDPGKRLALDPWLNAISKWDRNRDVKLARTEIDHPEVLDRFFRMDLDQSGDLDQQEWERHAAVFRRAQNAILAVKPSGRGDLTETALVWKYQRGVPYVATPLVHNGLVWMVKDGGIVTKLDATSGQLLGEERLPGMGGYYASPVAADHKVYFASELGVVTVVADQKDWHVISSHDFQEKIYATPLLTGQRLYLRTEQALYCFAGAPDGTAPVQ